MLGRDGALWFVLLGLGRVLGIGNPRKAVRDHDKAARPVAEGGLDPQTNLIDLCRVLADLCRALGIKTAVNVAARLAEHEMGVHIADTPGGPQQTTVVSESGMYTTIFASRKPQAERFRLRVTGDVIPSIRKRGG